MTLMQLLLDQYRSMSSLPNANEPTIHDFVLWCDQFLRDHPIASASIHADQPSTLTLRGHYGEFIVEVAAQEEPVAVEPTIDFLRQKDRGRVADPGYTDDFFSR